MLVSCVLDPSFRCWKDAAGRAGHKWGADCYKERPWLISHEILITEEGTIHGNRHWGMRERVKQLRSGCGQGAAAA